MYSFLEENELLCNKYKGSEVEFCLLEESIDAKKERNRYNDVPVPFVIRQQLFSVLWT